MGISKEKEGFESREANREQDTEKKRKQESESQASDRNNNEHFFKKRVEIVQFFYIVFINLCPSLVFSNLPHSSQSFITLTSALSPQSGGLQRIRAEANEGESAEKVKNKEGLSKKSWGWRKC